MRRYTHSANVDEPLQVETFDAAGSFDARYTYHADHLGSIRYLTDSAGSIVNAYDYDSYGRPMFGVTQFDQPFAYTGREWDQATGLYHYRARAYDAEMGRFLQEDPIGLFLPCCIEKQSQMNSLHFPTESLPWEKVPVLGATINFNINLSAYARFNPSNYNDPFGESPASSYARLQANTVRLIKNSNYVLRQLTNTLPKKAGRLYDPRNGRFTKGFYKEANKRSIVAQTAVYNCIKSGEAGFGTDITGLGGRLLGLLCYAAGAVAGGYATGAG